MKNFFTRVLGTKLYSRLINIYINLIGIKTLFINTYADALLFYKHSMVFKQNTFNKVESKIVLHYHAIEKGFLHNDFRYRFGRDRIIDLIKLLSLEMVIKNRNMSQIAAAYLAMCKYYERHLDSNVDVSDFYDLKDYQLFKQMTTLDKDIVTKYNSHSYFDFANADFANFSATRASVRNFTEEKIPVERVKEVINLARNAPSVCNRQPYKVYFLENKEKIENVLQIQGGLTGYTKEINQLFVVVTDRNYYYSIGERNQLYIDGGIFVMNLLYALHYYKIAACPAHWGHTVDKDEEIMKEIALSKSEKVICVIPFGIPSKNFKTTLSLRRDGSEILKIV